MRTEDQVITQFNTRLIRAVMPQGAPMIVVYEDPKDYPGLLWHACLMAGKVRT